ncbi:carbon-nitrogen hydrolase family protein [Reyranella sp.]|uniref:carbon-nitrogen hydrolase family protein n=1 Tax=Reyranella sp. TaxID=1929291 RepID=UPI003D1490CE
MSPLQAHQAQTIALLHLAPRPGDVEYNKRLIERAVSQASSRGARLIVTPELCLSGYGFRDLIGTTWIAGEQPALLDWAARLARRTGGASIVLGQPEADGDALFNSMIVLGPDGGVTGRHRKIAALRVGAESWSTPGDRPTVVDIAGIGRVGLFVCADMYSKRLVGETAAQGCDLLLSAAAWAPGEHGPSGEWEWASLTTQRPVLVCNRTGRDVLDFSGARSVAAVDGTIAFAHAAPDDSIVLVDWTATTRALSSWRTVSLDD